MLGVPEENVGNTWYRMLCVPEENVGKYRFSKISFFKISLDNMLSGFLLYYFFIFILFFLNINNINICRGKMAKCPRPYFTK
jgi:hypothetical protein